MGDIASLRREIECLEDEIRKLQKEREVGEDFIYDVNRGASHNEDEFNRRNFLSARIGEKRIRATFADKLMYRMQNNYGQIKRQQILESSNNMLKKAFSRIDEIDDAIANKRQQISNLENEIARIIAAQEEERRRHEACC
jgi:predicted  nucleic acid-binding Zn-ribbon protein